VLTFQQTDRRPEMHGLSSPVSLTDLLSSSRLEACLVVICHLSLGQSQHYEGVQAVDKVP
jgi:hypothetical protein